MHALRSKKEYRDWMNERRAKGKKAYQTGGLFFFFALFFVCTFRFWSVVVLNYIDDTIRGRGEAGQGEKRANDAWFKERLEPMEETFALELCTLKMQSIRHPLDQSSPDTGHSMTRESDREDTPVTLTMETYSKEGQGTGASTKD